jgi:prepilin-type processing-associated H-X9-DG protein
MDMHGYSRKAMTLIDVLAVIAAVLLLVFIWQAGYVRTGPGHTHVSLCMGNLGQIGKAVYLYAESNGEFYPAFTGRSASDSLALLYPDYVDSTKMFKCPSTKDAPKLAIIKGRDRKVIDRRFKPAPQWSSYGYDAEISFRTATALQPIAADMDGSSVASPGAHTANHGNGQNILFYDTHVGWKSVNTWNNGGVDDNIFTPDLVGEDTDTFIRR